MGTPDLELEGRRRRRRPGTGHRSLERGSLAGADAVCAGRVRAAPRLVVQEREPRRGEAGSSWPLPNPRARSRSCSSPRPWPPRTSKRVTPSASAPQSPSQGPSPATKLLRPTCSARRPCHPRSLRHFRASGFSDPQHCTSSPLRRRPSPARDKWSLSQGTNSAGSHGRHTQFS